MGLDDGNKLPLGVVGWTPIEVIPQIAPEKDQIVPKIREIPSTQDGQLVLTNLDSTQVKTENFHNGDAVSALDGTFDVICCPSEDSTANKQPCQDCMGVVKIANAQGQEILLVVQADGVGSGYNSEIAAGFSTRRICENGTSDMQANLAMVGGELQKLDLPMPATSTPDLLKAALMEIKKEHGTQTTLNQLRIELSSGRYSDLGLGDGELVIVRSNESIERFGQGTASSRATSRKGIEGVTTSHEGVLLQGDTLLMFSDGLDKMDNSEIAKLAKLTGAELQKTIEQLIPNLRDDDRGLFVYRQK